MIVEIDSFDEEENVVISLSLDLIVTRVIKSPGPS